MYDKTVMNEKEAHMLASGPNVPHDMEGILCCEGNGAPPSTG
jgi:hypothetical protein